MSLSLSYYFLRLCHIRTSLLILTPSLSYKHNYIVTLSLPHLKQVLCHPLYPLLTVYSLFSLYPFVIPTEPFRYTPVYRLFLSSPYPYHPPPFSIPQSFFLIDSSFHSSVPKISRPPLSLPSRSLQPTSLPLPFFFTFTYVLYVRFPPPL
jgi:hypothetical protein